MNKKIKRITALALLVAMIMTVFSTFTVYASKADEDNPVIEVTEHGIVITEACADEIEKKLQVPFGPIDRGGDEIRLDTSERIYLDEFYKIEQVDYVYDDPEHKQYSVFFNQKLSVREKAALFAEDERVTSIFPLSFYLIPEYPFPHFLDIDKIDQNGDYKNAIVWAARAGVAKGYNDGEIFGIGRPCTRREFLIFLWRTQECPKSANTDYSFNDIGAYSESSDTYKAILWAVSKGIVKGYKDGGFHPNETIKRKDALIMMYRAIKSRVTGDVEFPDVIELGYSKNSDTYQAIAWAEELGITRGYSDGTFRPLDNCLREQCVTFLYRAVCKGY